MSVDSANSGRSNGARHFFFMMSQKQSKKSGRYVQNCSLLSYFGSPIKKYL